MSVPLMFIVAACKKIDKSRIMCFFIFHYTSIEINAYDSLCRWLRQQLDPVDVTMASTAKLGVVSA